MSSPYITFLLRLYHSLPGRNPTSINPKFKRSLKFSDRPYVRDVMVGEEWQHLKLGDMESCGMMVVENTEGRNHKTLPTPEQVAETALKVVEVGVEVDAVVTTIAEAFKVPPGEALPGVPCDISKIRLRCRSGEASCTIYLFPE